MRLSSPLLAWLGLDVGLGFVDPRARRGAGAAKRTAQLDDRVSPALGDAAPARGDADVDDEDDGIVSRTLRLRDCIWARTAIDDLVAAEFALRLELSGEKTGSFVDFERLREQLDSRVDELAGGAGASALGGEERAALGERAVETTLALDAASEAARLKQAARRQLEAESAGSEDLYETDDGASDWDQFFTRVKRSATKVSDDLQRRRGAVAELGWLALRSGTNASNATAVVYVRDDGSVDWEGALAGARSATAFSVDLWRRINGVGEDHGGEVKPGLEQGGTEGVVLQRIAERARRADICADYAARKSKAFDAAVEQALKVASAESDANATSELPSLSLRASLRRADAHMVAARGSATLAALELAMELSCRLLEDEVTSEAYRGPGRASSRRVVAEFALLDAQLAALSRDARSVGWAVLRPELELISREIRDFATRLGALSDFEFAHLLEPIADAPLATLRTADQRSDPTKFSTWTAKLPSALAQVTLGADKTMAQVRRGLAFYFDGTRLLAADVSFCASLVAKALFEGETLGARDVRVLRRTVKDLTTAVPFIIILIIPLTPVGHIFVFSAIQRFFPDFFPSCYTERRQNLNRLYAAAELTKLPIQKASWWQSNDSKRGPA
ncbi:hypothetical protein M885DRAFT_524225 [Pelagophyceae sp. CCMP2097]|nr:hypothetical protein M885DRAFT_524225 [Pelagophyceae sp. CCMP2097]